ncbi:hypothetical protein, partial [Salmonella enterica]|uniref:hypothetical protein n=1 Tax=Salmonella enterica TaxID=28901 RepID=UPI0020C1CFB2
YSSYFFQPDGKIFKNIILFSTYLPQTHYGILVTNNFYLYAMRDRKLGYNVRKDLKNTES